MFIVCKKKTNPGIKGPLLVISYILVVQVLERDGNPLVSALQNVLRENM